MHLNGDLMELNENNNNYEKMDPDLPERIAVLERKVVEQNDELVCLKATLAEVLRRLSVLESAKSPIIIQRKETNIRIPTRQTVGKISPIDKNRNSALPQRSKALYQSTGSLHSDSHSSSSVSPAPSPSPRATPLPRKPPSPAVTTSNLHKRWSSTGDFYQTNLVTSSMQSKFSTKSVLNLYSKGNNFSNTHFKHGTKDAIFNEDDKSLKIFLRGRPIVLYAPSQLGYNYELNKVTTAPQKRLKLDWVYGYRGRDCRSNLYYLPTGEMIYFVASIVVLYNVEEQSQRHYLGHTDDVKSLAIHPSKMLIATGQSGGPNRKENPHIRVWNSVSLHTQAIIGINEFDSSICCLSFSKADGGALLVAIDEANDHNISVWEWQKGENGHKITETKCSVDTIVAAEFHPLDRNIIVTCGKSHIAFWSLDLNGTLYKRMGIFESRDKPKYVTCVSFLQTGETITGDSNGNLQIWGRGTNTILRFLKNVHDGPVFSICVLKDGTVVTGGGKDGRIVQFSSLLQKPIEENQIEGHFGGIRIISECYGSSLIVGTTRNCILNGTIDTGFLPIILGHSEEIWGLAARPNIPQFATAGHDKVLQLWDSMSHNILWSKDIGEQAQSLCFSQDGTIIIVGCSTGKWMIFDTQTRELVGHYTDGNEPIQAVQFSPDGTMVALGSRDGSISIYEMIEDKLKFNRIGRCAGHSSFVTHIDWSVDSQTLRSNSADHELFYWNASTCRQILQANSMRDVQWAANKCILTFATVGIWPENIEGSDVHCCDRNDKLLAVGDDSGHVKLYSYPAAQTKSLCHIYGGHSNPVTSVQFLHDNTRLISIGGKDTAVLQWIVN